MIPGAGSAKRCALVADDLTGACDAAVAFRQQGASSIVCLSPDLGLAASHEVVGVSTESRDLEASAIRRRICEVASRLEALRPTVIFKKIDSTLRGDVGAEICAALEAFGCECAVITPAFPQMGRAIRRGRLEVERDAGWKPIDVVERLRAQGIGDCIHVGCNEVVEAIERGDRFLSVETSCERDLQVLVSETARFGRRVLYAGSAGLANAVAERFFGGGKDYCVSRQTTKAGRLPHSGGSVLFCVGSDHPVTVAQLAALACERGSGRHGIVSISRGVRCAEIRELLKNAGQFTALLLSGGDTASLVCGAIEAEAIELEGEIVTGLPWGRLRGGLLDSLPVATKSGGFGSPNALISVADFFTCRRN